MYRRFKITAVPPLRFATTCAIVVPVVKLSFRPEIEFGGW